MSKGLGWKKGYSQEDISSLRVRLYEEYDKLKDEEKAANPMRYRYLPKSYYAEKLFDMHITPWTIEYISRLLTYRYRNDDR
jgi:hypothetical protein